jgi:hypothetical protein
MVATPTEPAEASPAAQPGCANCGAALTGPYCARCGQSAESIRRPMREFLEHALETLLELDSRGLHTMGLLLTRPGSLTAQYLAGRRARFVPPVRLYLFASLIFFLAVWATNTAIVQFVDFRTVRNLPAVAVRLFSPLEEGSRHAPSADVIQKVHVTNDNGETPAWFTRITENASRAFEAPAALNARLSELFPKMMFALVPAFGLILWLLYARKKRYLVEHLVFALHFHVFAFLLATVVIALRPILPPGVAGWLFFAPLGLYLLLALKRVYGQGWIRTSIKETLLVTLYGASFALGMVALSLAGIEELQG